MSRRCELTAKGVQVGHKVSHSNIKTKREFQPNLVDVTLASDALGQSYKLRITAAALRTVDHRGGLDPARDHGIRALEGAIARLRRRWAGQGGHAERYNEPMEPILHR